jgi:simple sugar transport system permease protein
MIFIGDKIPNFLLILIMLVVGVLAGGIWALIPAFFKAKWGTNETLFTLMMNYVAICIIDATIQALLPKGTGTMGVVNISTHAGWLPKIGNGPASTYLLSIIFVVVLTVLTYVYLQYSKHGYEISVVGESENTARYIGINVKKVIMRTMLISGAICGFCGFMLVSGYDHSVSTHMVGGRGFTAIMVTWLAKFNPIFMFFTAFLICFLEIGAGEVASNCGVSTAYADILVGIVLFFIIGCEFFINYKLHVRKKAEEVAQ